MKAWQQDHAGLAVSFDEKVEIVNKTQYVIDEVAVKQQVGPGFQDQGLGRGDSGLGRRVCVSVYAYAYGYAYVYAYAYVSVYVYVYAYAYVSVSVYLSVCAHAMELNKQKNKQNASCARGWSRSPVTGTGTRSTRQWMPRRRQRTAWRKMTTWCA